MTLESSLDQEFAQVRSDILTSGYTTSLEKLHKHQTAIFNDEAINFKALLKNIFSMSIEKFLNGKVTIDLELIKLQGELALLAMNKTNINEIEYLSINIDSLFAHKDLLLNHLTNPMNLDEFLKLTLSCSTDSYDRTYNLIPDQTKIKLQSEMIKLCLDKGTKINDSIHIGLNTLVNHHELLLNHPTNSISADLFLKFTLSTSITTYDSTSKEYIPDVAKIKLQSEMIKLCLDKGAKINDSIYIDLNTLVNHHELLLNHPTNSISADLFLKFTLSTSINTYDSASNTYIPDVVKIKLQGEMIKLCLDKGAKINDSDLSISSDNLANHYELFLNHPTNSISENLFLKFTLSTSINTYDSASKEYIPDEKLAKKKAKLIEIAYKNANGLLDIKEMQPLEALTVKELSNHGIIDNLNILKLALKASTSKWSEEKESYDLNNVAIQKQLIETYLAKDLSLENFSFKELNIENNHISILKIFLAQGLDPKALVIHDTDREDAAEVLHLALANNVKIPALTFIISLFSKEASLETAKLLINNIGYAINDKLDPKKVRDDFTNQGPKFQEYFDDLTEDVNFEDAVKPLFAEGGNLLHILAKSDKQELIEEVLTNYEYDINALNNLGQTALFFAQSPKVAQLLITHNADLSIKDKKGQIWVSNPSLELIEYAVEKNYLPKDYAERVALAHFNKGNYEHAAKLYKIGFELNVDPISEMVSSIINSLEVSIEKNKYQAILNLIDKAGIKIPNEFSHLLTSYRDDHSPKEFDFIYGLVHKLAVHYTNLSKATLAKTLGSSEGIDDAFATSNFDTLKAMYPGNIELARINDAFSAYYQIAGKALNILDNDFALEALTINGLRPNPLGQEVYTYRGMKVNLALDDIDSYFKYGHRGFSAGEHQKTLGFYVDQPWSAVGGRWEYGGTYSSVEAIWASHFANGITASIDAESVLLEIKSLESAPKICGSWKHEYELIPSTIAGESIVAIYILDIYSDKDRTHYQVNKVHKNPYIEAEITPHFKAYDKIKSDLNAIKTYDNLGCKDLPTISGINKSGLYKDYADFIERYTPQAYAADQAKLIEDYFSDRESYVEVFTYGINGECDLNLECCA